VFFVWWGFGFALWVSFREFLTRQLIRPPDFTASLPVAGGGSGGGGEGEALPVVGLRGGFV